VSCRGHVFTKNVAQWRMNGQAGMALAGGVGGAIWSDSEGADHDTVTFKPGS
jgi:hypothetical protein